MVNDSVAETLGTTETEKPDAPGPPGPAARCPATKLRRLADRGRDVAGDRVRDDAGGYRDPVWRRGRANRIATGDPGVATDGDDGHRGAARRSQRARRGRAEDRAPDRPHPGLDRRRAHHGDAVRDLCVAGAALGRTDR